RAADQRGDPELAGVPPHRLDHVLVGRDRELAVEGDLDQDGPRAAEGGRETIAPRLPQAELGGGAAHMDGFDAGIGGGVFELGARPLSRLASLACRCRSAARWRIEDASDSANLCWYRVGGGIKDDPQSGGSTRGFATSRNTSSISRETASSASSASMPS